MTSFTTAPGEEVEESRASPRADRRRTRNPPHGPRPSLRSGGSCGGGRSGEGEPSTGRGCGGPPGSSSRAPRSDLLWVAHQPEEREDGESRDAGSDGVGSPENQRHGASGRNAWSRNAWSSASFPHRRQTFVPGRRTRERRGFGSGRTATARAPSSYPRIRRSSLCPKSSCSRRQREQNCGG